MKKRTIFILTSIVLIAVILCGCGSKASGPDVMDFNEKLDLKKPDPAPGEYPVILFVGNSHTFANDMPDIFMAVAGAMGNETDVYSLTEGYYTLTDYANTEDELGAELDAALSSMHWDFVILQENTNDAFLNSEKTMLPAAQALDKKIRNAGGQTALLMTWTPKDGLDNGNISLSRQEVQSVISKNYIEAADKLDSLLIPAGTAFMVCNEKYPEIELWDEDKMHPSLKGSYLTALVTYAVLYRQSPVGCPENMGIEEDVAKKLQEIAAEVVLGE